MICPTWQYPHCGTLICIQAFWTGCNPLLSRPSIVVTSFPAVSRIAVTQDRVACPFTWTVHAPQSPTPQPNFDPVRPKMSRRYQSSGISGSPLKDCSAPFTVSWIIFLPHHKRKWGMKSIEPRSTPRGMVADSSQPIVSGTQMSLLLHLQNHRREILLLSQIRLPRINLKGSRGRGHSHADGS